MNGIDCTAESARTSFAVPAVLSHNVARPGTPVTPKFICPLNRASINDCVPPKVLYSGLREKIPALAACFSTSLSVFITISGKYGRPCWMTITMLAASSAHAERRDTGAATTGEVESTLQRDR